MKMSNLLTALRSEPNIRKIFGKREIKIIEKQLLGINLTQSEKNRLSRDIRKKFNAIKELSKFEKQFDLKKAGKIKELIKDTKEIILESKYKPNIKSIILFGSAVENKLTHRSDIDIAVEFKNITSKQATEFRINISGKTDDKIDIQVYNILPAKIKKQIKQKHKILWKKE